ncbi:putative uncharacterized protein [Clostridium sp. CAG:710]|nr:putative uncharacterized protein [Clostridium sp. CAG:710]
MKDKKGFTLTELLAVIVLIGVILAIAVPSYQSYVTRTRKEVLKSYQANIIDAANQYAAECFQENKLGECKRNENIWDDIKKNLKNSNDILKEYNVTVKIDNGPSNVSDLYSITLEMTKKGSTKPITIKTSNTNTSGSTGTQTDSSININGNALNTEKNTIEGIFPTNTTLNITGSVQKVMLKDKETTCTSEDSLFNYTTTCNLKLENGENKIKITYKDGNAKEITINADTISPKIEPSNINTSPTNKVEFTVTITDENLKEVTKFPKECKIVEDKEKIKRYTCTITENGRYSFSATDKVDNIETKDITISNITSEKPSVILNIDSEAVSKSKIIEIEYISGSNGNEIGFNTDQKLKWSLINTSNNQEERTGEFTNLSNKGSQNVKIEGLTGTYSFIVKGLTNKAGNKNDDEKLTIHLDNTPPSAAVVSKPSKDEEKTKSVECGGLDNNGNRECKVVFYGGFLGAEVKAKLNFTVEDIGSSEVGKVYYRTTTTGNFTETTVNAINDLHHKDFNKGQLNLYIEVVFADALGNIDYTKNITKITFVKN